MLPSLVTRNDTVPWGTVAWSALRPMATPPIMALLWPPIIAPPMFVRETFTTVPGRLGSARAEPDSDPEPPGLTPPRIIVGTAAEPPRAPTATAAEATRAITAVASAPTSTGRLVAVTSARPGEQPAEAAKAPGRSARRPVGGGGSP